MQTHPVRAARLRQVRLCAQGQVEAFLLLDFCFVTNVWKKKIVKKSSNNHHSKSSFFGMSRPFSFSNWFVVRTSYKIKTKSEEWKWALSPPACLWPSQAVCLASCDGCVSPAGRLDYPSGLPHTRIINESWIKSSPYLWNSAIAFREEKRRERKGKRWGRKKKERERNKRNKSYKCEESLGHTSVLEIQDERILQRKHLWSSVIWNGRRSL